MGNFRLCFIWLISIAVFGQNQTQQMAFQQLNVEQGLSQNSVISIAQDSIGYMWFATQDGLNKYNGRDFKYYNKQFEDITRASFSNLGEIYIDTQNRLWIITHSGNLELYQPQTDNFKPIKLNFKASTVFQDAQKNLFIGTYNNGLFKIDAKTKDTIQIFKNDDTSKTVYELASFNNKVFVATSGALFQVSKSNTYQSISVASNKNVNFSALAQDNNQTIWLGSFGNGLFYQPKGHSVFKPFNHINLPKNLNIEDLLIDSKNNLWLVTYGHGAYYINLKTHSVTNFKANKNNPFALHYNDILCLYQDITGLIWFGTDGTGASFYDQHLIKFNMLTNNQVSNEVNVDMVRSLTTDKNENLWIGTSGKGLTYFDQNIKQYKTLTTNNSNIASNRVISLNYYDDDLWVGHQGYGLNTKKTSGGFKFYNDLSDYTIWKIIPETKHRRWLATERHGLVLFDKIEGVLKSYNANNSVLKENNIRTAIQENDSIFWLGAENTGVYKLNIKTDNIDKIEVLHDKIKSLYVADNLLWVGTLGSGLKKYNIKTKNVDSYGKAEGLPNQVVYGILPDNQNNLWLSTNNGLCKFNPVNISFESFTTFDGLQNAEFNTGAYYKGKNGVLYFGGLDGVNWFSPELLTYNTVKPKTIISNFEVFSQNYSMHSNTTLNYNENTVTFTFSSLHFSQPERNLFKYRLLNYDKDWVNSKSVNFAHYTNLAPGNYTFQVISSNYDGVWNNQPASYTFTILKPWYFTNGMKLFYALLVLLILFGVYRYLRFRWQIKTQLQLEHAETERLKKLDEFKTKLYTNISHEFRTPLTLILGPLENQLANQKLPEQDKNELQLIKQNANRLLGLVNQMVDLSIIDSGQAQLKVKAGNLNVLLQQILAAFSYKASEKGIKIESKIHNLENAWFDTDVIEKISSNLLSNAIKYAPEQSKIVLNANRQNEAMVFSITNTNKDILRTDLGKLFQRFYQDNEASEGVGVGLALVKELVSLSHGSIIANSIAQDKIQFNVTLPITKAAFKTSEIIEDNNIPSVAPDLEIFRNENSENSNMLIVEDEPEIRKFIVSIFKTNYNIIEASNGKIGIEQALKHQPDIIISDIMMPETNGIALCNTLKYNELTSHIPIILLTAKVGDKNEMEGLKTGADAYITKPFNSEKLKLRVEKLIENRKTLQNHFLNNFSMVPAHIKVTSTESEFLKRLKQVVDECLTEPDFTAEAFANQMQMSRTQLHRKLKAVVGLSASEFIRNQRLQLAVNILKKHPDVSVSEIAYQVGFNTPSYFIKCFKAVYKCTPNEFSSK
ncbi:histidine kinase [Tamlana nanhaiensis]|uniref:histidine kinase n=1 Tax=Neotamlana nanhaiensis TaxID=1382798 RepID=A0A0D7W3B9_9FLAO|nr:hybrid sensor histidine kinase/response regulator transcription factor [Tamlana nanhaiensis]KJD33596.1 histidine kinase [Tamlana nanhaiensis]